MDFRSAAGYIKDRTPLSDLVREVTGDEGRNKGANSFFFRCPFHSENTGSFHVRDNEGSYKCFGCGEAGDAIDFVANSTGISKRDALEYLYDRAGIQLDLDGSAEEKTRYQERRNTRGVMSALADRCAAMIFSADAPDSVALARKYATDLDLGNGVLMKFGVGAFDGLQIPVEDADPEAIKALTMPLKEGRLIIPIRDASSRTIAFASRALDGSQPKYLNSYVHDGIYEKKKVLYGIDVARKSIMKTREVYFVEGYTDVWGMNAIGIENVVAVCSAQLTEEQAMSISSLVDIGVVIPDMDDAGRNGAIKSMIALASAGIVPYVAVLPISRGQDPYDCAKEYGEEMHEIVQKSGRMSFVEWILDPVEKGDIDQMTRSMRSVSEIISAMDDALMREASLIAWSDHSGVPYSTLKNIADYSKRR